MCFHFLQWTLDPQCYQLFYRGTPVELRRQTLKLLTYFVKNPGRLITREELMENIWAGRCVCDDSVTTCIKELRKVLNDTRRDKKFIATRHGLGYQFVAPVLYEEKPEGRAGNNLPVFVERVFPQAANM